jgi:hypothetical protein
MRATCGRSTCSTADGGGSSPASLGAVGSSPSLPRRKLAVARAGWPRGREPRSAEEVDLREGAPDTWSAHAAASVVSRNCRGVMTQDCPRRPPAAGQACLRPRATRSGHRLAEAAVGSDARCCGHRGCTSRRLDGAAASDVSACAGRRRGPLLANVAATIPRNRRRQGVHRESVRGTLLRLCVEINRSKRLAIRPGRALASTTSAAQRR